MASADLPPRPRAGVVLTHAVGLLCAVTAGVSLLHDQYGYSALMLLLGAANAAAARL